VKYFPLTMSHIFQVILVGIISAVTMNAHADALDELGSRPMTVNERQFIENVIHEVEHTFSTPDGEWKRKMQVSVGNDIYHRNTRQGDIYEGYNVVPVPMNIQLNFQQQTASQVQQTKSAKQHAVNTDDLMKKIMQASANQDEKAIERLSQQMAALQSTAYNESMGKLIHPEARNHKEKGKAFIIQILINDGGETIGKKYEVAEAKETYTFLIRRKKQAQYKYYLGLWQVRGTNEGNVAIHLPETMQAKDHHLKILTMSVNITGPGTVVDGYVHDHVELQSLRNMKALFTM